MSRHSNCKAYEINRAGSIGTGHTRFKTKKAKQAEIELLTQDFLMNGGQIQELPSEHIESKWNPAWRDYAESAYQERNS